jgi:hypothetical protein
LQGGWQPGGRLLPAHLVKLQRRRQRRRVPARHHPAVPLRARAAHNALEGPPLLVLVLVLVLVLLVLLLLLLLLLKLNDV